MQILHQILCRFEKRGSYAFFLFDDFAFAAQSNIAPAEYDVVVESEGRT